MSQSRQVYAKLIRGDVLSARQILAELPKTSRDKSLARLAERIEERFFSPEPARGAQARCLADVVSAEFQHYYVEVLTRSRAVKEAEKQLFQRLRLHLAREYRRDVKTWGRERIENLITQLLSEQGLHALFGNVKPFCSCLIWKVQTERFFRINTLAGKATLQVTLLDDFLDLGWMHFATFGKYHVGGWANSTGIFAVLPAYKDGVRSEAFRVSLLKHEGQHAFDLVRYPKMRQCQLEYRAKLNELNFYANPLPFLRRLVLQADQDKDNPHAYAADTILRQLHACYEIPYALSTARLGSRGHCRTLFQCVARSRSRLRRCVAALFRQSHLEHWDKLPRNVPIR